MEPGSRVETLERFFTSSDGLNLSSDEFSGLSKAAFEMYAEFHSATFPRSSLKERIGSAFVEALIGGRVLLAPDSDDVQFEHQLLQDFLAGRHLAMASDQMMWVPSAFDAVSFDGNSTDALSFTQAQLGSRSATDKFLKRIYDWNWYAAVRCLAEAVPGSCSKEILTAILCVVAEKRFDQVRGTRKRAEDVLERFTEEIAVRLRLAPDLEHLCDVAPPPTVDAPGWYKQWRDLFRLTPQSQVRESDLAKISSSDSIIGWTTANVLRRLQLAEIDLRQLRGIYLGATGGQAAAKSLRWRVVHCLGAFPSRENADLLLRAIQDDPYAWVHYGAVRSLIEIAATTQDGEFRTYILSSLRQLLPVLSREPLSQIGWASLHDGASRHVGRRNDAVTQRSSRLADGFSRTGRLGRKDSILRGVHRRSQEERLNLSENDSRRLHVDELCEAAWRVRENGHIWGNTKVGAALLSTKGRVFIGCNVEHRFRSHDVHAEVNALTSMVSAGDTKAAAIVIASERQKFTPCGACLDWIFELGGPDCIVGFQFKPGGAVSIFTAQELMPHYPA